ncbi:MAG: YWFCY domain-containing protein [Chitinophagaceae bacterium]
MQTGENEQGLRKILDLTRMISIAILFFHFYYCCVREYPFPNSFDNCLLRLTHTSFA